MERHEDRSSMQEPGLCFVCETSPQAGVVDTLQNFSPGFPSNLSGRKYVCDGCAKAIAEAEGFYASEDIATATRRADEADARYNAVRSHVAVAIAQFSDEALVGAGDASSFVVANTPAPAKPKKAAKDEAPAA